METKIISIDISPETKPIETENAGVMWEHNATQLVFNIDNAYIGDYKYYLEYRSLIGTKVRTEYLTLNTETNTITYDIPVTMSSLKGVECYFNIIMIDGDGNTIQVIKPHKFCLQFDYSPNTDNSIAKVNDFSINALLEAIRLGTFKGDKGDKGDTGAKGDKGDKGDTGEISESFATGTFANTIKNIASGNPIVVNDVSPVTHAVDVKSYGNVNFLTAKLTACGKNIIPTPYYFSNQMGSGSIFTVQDDGGILINGTTTATYTFHLIKFDTFKLPKGKYKLSLKNGIKGSVYLVSGGGSDGLLPMQYSIDRNINMTEDFNIGYLSVQVAANTTVENLVVYPQLEIGEIETDYEQYKGKTYNFNADGTCKVESISPDMTIFTNAETLLECEYNMDTAVAIEKVKNYAKQEVDSVREYVETLGYRLLGSLTLESDIQRITVSEDANGNLLKNMNLKKFFVLFIGSFVNTASTTLFCNINGGNIYQMYNSFNPTADRKYGFWLESENIITLSDKAVFKSTYTSALLTNFTETGSGQGLGGNNVALNSDLSVVGNINNIQNISFGSFNSNNLMKAGSTLYLFGI